MSTRRTPRRRRRARKHGTATLVISVAAAALASYRAGLVLAIAIALTAGILATVVIIARRHPYLLQPGQPDRAPATRARRAASQGRHALSGPAPAPDGRKVISDAAQSARDGRARGRARKLGWLPPPAELLTVTRECAEGDCHLCPDPPACEHCNHDPAEIVARNRARFDAAAAANGDVPPF